MKRIALLVLLAACPKSGDKPKPIEPVGSGSANNPGSGDAAASVTLPPAPPLPAVPAGLPAAPANPRVTPDAVALGELLFWDPRLSASGARACASCHDPEHGYSGGIDKAADGKDNLRRTPALVNLAWVNQLGWDGRYASVGDLLPPHIKGQLGDALEATSARVDAVPLYHAHIARLGGSPSDAVAQALEAFVLTRYEGDAPWDRMERTAAALTKPGTAPKEMEVAGYQLFMGKAQCGVCHLPPLYTDGGYHVVAENPFNDPARGKVDPAKKGAFRTPTLRGAALRSGLFHLGSQKALDQAIVQYIQASQITNADAIQLDPIVRKIRIDGGDETLKLLAFLKALSADRPAPTKPVLP